MRINYYCKLVFEHDVCTVPEKGGRKPAPSPNLFVSAEKCRGSVCHARSYHPKRPLTIPYEQKPKPSAAPLEDFSLLCNPSPPFLSITSHPLANYLVPNPNGRCSPLSFGVPPFSSIFTMFLTIFLRLLSFFSSIFPAVPPLSSVFLLRNLP